MGKWILNYVTVYTIALLINYLLGTVIKNNVGEYNSTDDTCISKNKLINKNTKHIMYDNIFLYKNDNSHLKLHLEFSLHN